jgi:amino acid permease
MTGAQLEKQDGAMTIQLSPEEQSYLEDLLAWDAKRRATESIALQFALVFGGVLIVAVSVLTLLDLTDATIFALLVPGFVAGIFLIAAYLVGRSRLRDRHRIAHLARKLMQAT